MPSLYRTPPPVLFRFSSEYSSTVLQWLCGHLSYCACMTFWSFLICYFSVLAVISLAVNGFSAFHCRYSFCAQASFPFCQMRCKTRTSLRPSFSVPNPRSGIVYRAQALNMLWLSWFRRISCSAALFRFVFKCRFLGGHFVEIVFIICSSRSLHNRRCLHCPLLSKRHSCRSLCRR